MNIYSSKGSSFFIYVVRALDDFAPISNSSYLSLPLQLFEIFLQKLRVKNL